MFEALKLNLVKKYKVINMTHRRLKKKLFSRKNVYSILNEI